MNREKIFNAFFKNNENGEQRFENFTQLTSVGKRIVYIVIHLALGESKPKTAIQWLKEKNIISHSQSDSRTVYQIIHHWKNTGEIFQKFSKNFLSLEEHISSIHEKKIHSINVLRII